MIALSTTLLLRTGSEPGRPMQTGQICVLGSAPNLVLHAQKILDWVESWV